MTTIHPDDLEALLVSHVVSLANRAECAALAAKQHGRHGWDNKTGDPVSDQLSARARAAAYFNALVEADRVLSVFLRMRRAAELHARACDPL